MNDEAAPAGAVAGELGQPGEAAPGAARPYRWCRHCGEPVTLAPGRGRPWLRKAIHTATGLEGAPDGHMAAPVDEDPALRRQADAIEAEYRVNVSVRFGFFRADRAGIADPVHWEARSAEDLRRQLPAWLRRTGQPQEASR